MKRYNQLRAVALEGLIYINPFSNLLGLILELKPAG